MYESIEQRLLDLDGELYDLIREAADCITWQREMISGKDAIIRELRREVAALRGNTGRLDREKALEIVENANLGGVLREAVEYFIRGERI